MKDKTQNGNRPSADAPELQAQVAEQLAMLDPELEVLLVELSASKGSRVLRVYLDHPGGVDHALCARATGQLGDLLRDYAVEVSSPGPSRPLTKPHHYRRFLGRRVRVRTRDAIEGRSEFKGELVGADDRGVELAGEWGTVSIAHERIRRSNLVPQAVQVPRRPR